MTKAEITKMTDDEVATAYKKAVVVAKAMHDASVVLRVELYGRQEIAMHQAALNEAKAKHAKGGIS